MKELRDKELIYNYFRKNPGFFTYQIGDLDDFFWDYTNWYALCENETIKQIALLYSGSDLKVLLASSGDDIFEMQILLNMILEYLPDRLYSHLSPGLYTTFEETYDCIDNGRHYKMELQRSSFKKAENDDSIRRLTIDDFEIANYFYNSNYPGNWFDKRMLETGKYFGYFNDGLLRGISGIHVYSQKYKIAALGNILTDPSCRGMGICQKITSVLCEDLFETVEHIGLNVHIDNISAINCYQKLGFKIAGEYEEFLFERKK